MRVPTLPEVTGSMRAQAGRLAGILIALVLVAGSLAVAGRPAGAAANLPPLRLIAPTSHAQLRNPIAVVIETPGDISQLTMSTSMSGMAMGGVHLHITVDGKVFMPATQQMKKVAASRYSYQLSGKLSAGTHTIKVFWADDKTHATAGTPQAVTFTVVG